ncbi:MAG: TRAP transporter substrate-binding protein DctP [Spirochaetaceae bacterium]|jgi:TRAP-type C4-dicarboxylate transport system substrate-binding protein|nr:TRAP transporter substrate-binding protein DctP [Spirochaetaceae bacterium]
MKKLLIILGVMCSAAGMVFAAPIQIKLASIAPEATAWGRALNQMAKEWAAATGGEVRLIVYHNGMLGSAEGEVLKKLRMNQVQAAVFTSVGMNGISKKIFTLSAPLLVRNDEEMDYVLSSLGPDLEQTIEQSGFKLAAWSRVGWIRFFGRQPISAPDDLRKQKLAAPDDMPELSNIFKSMGYTCIPVSYNDTLIALSSNKVDAVFQVPPFVAAMQIFGVAKNMCQLDVAPVLGGIVMNQATWKRIPDKYKPRLIEIARKIARENDAGAKKLTSDAIDIMRRNGLVTNPFSAPDEQLWVDEVRKAIPEMLEVRDSVLDQDIYHRTEALLQTVRSRR